MSDLHLRDVMFLPARRAAADRVCPGPIFAAPLAGAHEVIGPLLDGRPGDVPPRFLVVAYDVQTAQVLEKVLEEVIQVAARSLLDWMTGSRLLVYHYVDDSGPPTLVIPALAAGERFRLAPLGDAARSQPFWVSLAHDLSLARV